MVQDVNGRVRLRGLVRLSSHCESQLSRQVSFFTNGRHSGVSCKPRGYAAFPYKACSWLEKIE